LEIESAKLLKVEKVWEVPLTPQSSSKYIQPVINSMAIASDVVEYLVKETVFKRHF